MINRFSCVLREVLKWNTGLKWVNILPSFEIKILRTSLVPMSPFNTTWKTSKNFWFLMFSGDISANIYLFKVNNKNTSKRCEICSKLTLKTPEWCQWHRSGVFIINFEYLSHLFLVFLLLTLNKQMLAEMEENNELK